MATVFTHYIQPGDRRRLDAHVEGMNIHERIHWYIEEQMKQRRGEKSLVRLPSTELLDGRHLQQGILRQQYTFEDCTFQHNSQPEKRGDQALLIKHGVFSIDTPFDNGVFSNCTFFNNSFGNPDHGVRMVVADECPCAEVS